MSRLRPLFAMLAIFGCAGSSSESDGTSSAADNEATEARAERGLSAQGYAEDELFQPLSIIESPSGHGVVAMVDGYLFVPFSRDGNGGNGGFDFYDISDPRNPVRVSRTQNAETGQLLEPHLYGFHPTADATYFAHATRSGISIWDFSDIFSPHRVSSLTLPGFGSSGYSGVPWSIFWQAPYLFVGGTNQGVYVVDTSEVEAPRLVAHVPAVEIGGFPVGQVYALGDRLIVTAVDNAGLATLDISNPFAPVLVEARRDVPRSYASGYYGGRVYAAGTGGRLHTFDVSGPSGIQELGSVSSGLSLGGYPAFQDDFVFSGFSTGIGKYDLVLERFVGSGTSGIASRDEDFATPIGNLVFAGSDHLGGSALMPHQREADTEPPSVVEIVPAPGSLNQALTTRVGIRFSDEIELSSVTAENFIVRSLASGEVLSGQYSAQNGFVHFAPDAPLQASTRYEVALAAGGIRDWSGNPLASKFTASFETGEFTLSPIPSLFGNGPARVGAAVNLQVSLPFAVGTPRYRFDFGDGSPPSPPSSDPTARHVYEAPGNYLVTVRVEVDGRSLSASRIQVVHRSATASPAATSSNLALLPVEGLVAVANTDNHSVTLLFRQTLQKRVEIEVGRRPTSLARAPSGALWVVCEDSAEIYVIDLETARVTGRIPLPRASRPHGLIFDPPRGVAYVSLQATGEVVAVDANGSMVNRLHVGASPRGLSLPGGGNDLWVSHFISREAEGRLSRVALPGFAAIEGVVLSADPGPDSEASGRGVPNYVGALAISPDGIQAVVPSKKDNVLRGGFRDGLALTFESTVRAMLAWIDPLTGLEEFARRIDFDDAALPAAAVFSERGNLLYVVTRSSRDLRVVDAYDGRIYATLALEGHGADGLLVDADRGRLLVRNELSRSLEVFDVFALERFDSLDVPRQAVVPLVAREALSPEVLHGKQLFYDSRDPRLARDGYLSCSACHLEGGSDERVWDFTDRVQGFRRTISLRGRGGTRLGAVHWTANFDEIQDFENDIRAHSGGTGLMGDADFQETEVPLGPPKAGRSRDLDDLAAYVSSLERAHPSPYRQGDGGLTPAGLRGQAIFHGVAACGSCHSGPDYSDGRRHDVGTLKPHSGSNGPEALAGVGFKTPPLTGLWERRDLLHDGSAKSLDEVLLNPLHGDAHGLDAADREDLVAFLLQVESPRAFLDGLLPEAYELGSADLGAPLYVDEPSVLESVPAPYRGHVLVRTAGADKLAAGTEHLRFRVEVPAQVLVAYDAGAAGLPPWLETWTEEPGALLESADGKLLRLYSRDFPAGSVILGGNQPGSADSMYVVLVAPLVSGTGIDSDGDGVEDSIDNCTHVSNAGLAGCDSDRDGYGNACDGDFDQSLSVGGEDFRPIFLTDFEKGSMSPFLGVPNGTDMNCDGKVDGGDFWLLVFDQYDAGVPGPSGFSCAGGTRPCP